jgi:uncharacterized protein YjaG (DUF416 family)
MVTIRFEESQLGAQLDRLPQQLRAAFAAACAERVFPAYVRYSQESGRGDPETLRAALSRLWDDLTGDPVSEQELNANAKRCLALAPKEDVDPWVDSLPGAQDAVITLVHALEASWKVGSQEAVWSARCAYDAIDRFVRFDDSGMVVTANEQRLLEHPLVQAELVRQRRDLDELLGVRDVDVKESAARLRHRAREESTTFFEVASSGTRAV